MRQILEEQGLLSNNIYEVAGKADTDPMFPDDPYIAALSARDHYPDARTSAGAARTDAVKDISGG